MRVGKPCFVERQSVLLYFIDCERQSRIEMSAESLYKVQWNFPDAEESEYMVDTKAVEVFL